MSDPRDTHYAGPTGREKPGEHWNARIIREEREQAMSDKVDYKIPDEAVGAAARAYYENLGWDWDDLGGWHEDKQRELDHEESKATILREFRAALEAAIPLLPASGGPAVAPTLHEQWHLDHPGYPCEYAEDAAAARTPAVDRQVIERVLRQTLGSLGWHDLHEPIRTDVINKWTRALTSALVAALTEQPKENEK